jgi:hypothetical protein
VDFEIEEFTAETQRHRDFDEGREDNQRQYP